MRWTQTLIPTLKQAPAEAQAISHQLMLRAGMVRQLSAGVFDLLPAGTRVMRKIERIIRQEMQSVGAVEVMLPATQPAELWQRTGRDVDYGPNLIRFKDRHGRHNVLGPTHEEVVTELVAASVRSHRQLPLTLFQIGPKFRDEYRPRAGLMRLREFVMKDAYSFHADESCLRRMYEAMSAAYARIFRRCGIEAIAVQAESGPIGGGWSQEFVCLSPAGEDIVLTSSAGNYAANVERAEIGRRDFGFDGAAAGELTTVDTPGLKTVAEVAASLGIQSSGMLKTLVYRATDAQGPRWLVAAVRGDHQVSEGKLARQARERFGIQRIELADDPQVRQRWAIGFVSPRAACAADDTALLVDVDAAQPRDWTTGADEPDRHVRHFSWQRECGAVLNDPTRLAVADIRSAADGDPSPLNDGGVLRAQRAIEIGHVFELGTRYTQPLGAMIQDESGQPRPMLMGTYGIGLGRIIVAAIESHHDQRGIVFPDSIAPWSVCITPVQYEGAMRDAADGMLARLSQAGVDAILDDRDARPGVKFADADLLGIPLRITIGQKHLAEGHVEIKRRTSDAPEVVGLDEAAARAAAYSTSIASP